MSIKVMGHCPPDTDSTCSPIVYSWFLNSKGLDTKPYIGGKPNKEALFVLNHFNQQIPELIESVNADDQLVLIDTNNPEELIAGWENAQIVEIVDHHKLYGIKTTNIPKVTIRAYGCVATVLWEIMKNEGAQFNREMSGLLIACILSDTLKFTSPTTTDIDKKAVDELSKIAGIDINEFSAQMFDAKSDLSGLSAREILLSDAKEFDISGKLYKIAVLETTNPTLALGKQLELKPEIEKLKSEGNLAGFFFFVVDILNSNSTVLVASEDEQAIVEQAFNVKREQSGLILLPGIVSRKKQMIPTIESFLTK